MFIQSIAAENINIYLPSMHEDKSPVQFKAVNESSGNY